jgi:SAM-dependent methyltransferase
LTADTHAERLVRSLDRLTLCEGVFVMPQDHTATVDSWAMSLMHSPLLARIYEGSWRPAAVRALSTLTDAAEDAIVDRYLEPRVNLRILDLCCGTARVSRRWIPRHADVLGVDLSLAMLREARRRCTSERLVLVRVDAGSPIAHTRIFDAAFCFAALHLLERPENVISAAAEALRPGGLFFAWVATTDGIMRVPLVRKLMGSFGLRLWRPMSLADGMTAHGLEVLESLRFGAVEFVVARRQP